MFRASMNPSSGDTTVFMQHLLLGILCGRLSVMQGAYNNEPNSKEIKPLK